MLARLRTGIESAGSLLRSAAAMTMSATPTSFFSTGPGFRDFARDMGLSISSCAVPPWVLRAVPPWLHRVLPLWLLHAVPPWSAGSTWPCPSAAPGPVSSVLPRLLLAVPQRSARRRAAPAPPPRDRRG